MPSPSLRTKNLVYAAGLTLVGGVFACAPLLLRRPEVNLTTQPGPLQPSQVMRGAYLNTGSQDVGADPDWVDGKYVGARHFRPSEADVAEARARFVAKLAAAKRASE